MSPPSLQESLSRSTCPLRAGTGASRARVAARHALVASIVSTLLASPQTTEAASFTDVTSQAGLIYVQRATPVTTQVTPDAAEQASGGAAPADFDGDGWVDIFASRVDAPAILFRNLGDGTFEDVTEMTGDLADALPTGSSGAVWGDIDNDGDPDLYVTSYGTTRFHLFINNADGTFTENAVARGAATDSGRPHFGMGAALGDYDRDGYLDLFVAEWRVHPRAPELPLPGQSHNRLLRNRGEEAPGFFEDVTLAAGFDIEQIDGKATSALGIPGFSPGFVDFDGDGWPDLTWVADWGHSRLFWNNGDGTFTDGTDIAGVGLERSGMGSTQDDFDGDGDLDWLVTSIYGRENEIQHGVSNQLYLNRGDRTFENATITAGVGDGGFGWGVSGFDFDNDGDTDFVNTNGFLAPGHPDDIKWASDRTRIYENLGNGQFTDIAADAGVLDTEQGKGLFTFDHDRDGDLDIMLVNHGAAPVLYRNDTETAPWLQVGLTGTNSNRDGIGALVTLRPTLDDPAGFQVSHINANSNFLSHDEVLAHFGLGSHVGTVDRVSIHWPSGQLQVVDSVQSGQRIEIVEGQPAPGCLAAERSSWRFGSSRRGPTSNRLVWKMWAPLDTRPFEFEPVDSDANYRVTIEDHTGWILNFPLDEDPERVEEKGGGFRYTADDATPEAALKSVLVRRVRAKPNRKPEGTPAGMMVKVVAVGPNLALPTTMPHGPVDIRLTSDAPRCWQATFGTNEIQETPRGLTARATGE